MSGEHPGSFDEQRSGRVAKVDRLRSAGSDPYPVGFAPDAAAAELASRFAELEAGTDTDEAVAVAGRVMLLRPQGKLTFATLRDASGEIQLFAAHDDLGDGAHAEFGDLDLGDLVWARGTVMTTKRGELSVRVREFRLLAKALRPLPDKWHGLADVDTRFRQREVDLIANEDARALFERRHRVVRRLRDHLHAEGFVEVETPILQPSAGGAAARPFVTRYHALDADAYLRIAPELYLKRLVVAGYERVFELGRVFRNEGLSTRHNPEFTMLEAYRAYAGYEDMVQLTQDLVLKAAGRQRRVRGADGTKVDLAPPWERRTLLELVEEHAGVRVHPSMPADELRKTCDGLDVEHEAWWGPGKLVLEIFEKTTEPNIVGPTFVMDYPLEVSPFARTHPDDPDLVERFELIVGGREVANAFTELNDPVEQRRRFEMQERARSHGDAEAHGVDEEYLRALEVGLPPCGGLGIGVDRLVMLLAGAPSIREVLFFPFLRPKGDDA